MTPPREPRASQPNPVVERARTLRQNLTFPERMLWNTLRRRSIDGHKFRRQHPIGPYVCDFACYEARLIVEIDGATHDAQWSHDQRRDAWLREQGWRILRVTNAEVIQDRDAVVTAIRRALASSSPLPLGEGAERSEAGDGV